MPYNEDQPRVPAGSPDGGQFGSGGGSRAERPNAASLRGPRFPARVLTVKGFKVKITQNSRGHATYTVKGHGQTWKYHDRPTRGSTGNRAAMLRDLGATNEDFAAADFNEYRTTGPGRFGGPNEGPGRPGTRRLGYS